MSERQARRRRRPLRSPDRRSGSPEGSSSQSSQEIAISTHQPPSDPLHSTNQSEPVIEYADAQAFYASQPLVNSPLSCDHAAPLNALDASDFMVLSAPLIPMLQEGLGQFDGFPQLSALEHDLCSSVESLDQALRLSPEPSSSFSSNSFPDGPLEFPQLDCTFPKLRVTKLFTLRFIRRSSIVVIFVIGTSAKFYSGRLSDGYDNGRPPSGPYFAVSNWRTLRLRNWPWP